MTGKRNLTPERGPSVWDRESLAPNPDRRSLWLSGLGGVALAVTGTALAAVGGSMVYRAARAQGHGRAHAFDAPSLDPLPLQANRLEDVVADESDQSFPASDAPSWTRTTAGRK